MSLLTHQEETFHWMMTSHPLVVFFIMKSPPQHKHSHHVLLIITIPAPIPATTTSLLSSYSPLLYQALNTATSSAKYAPRRHLINNATNNKNTAQQAKSPNPPPTLFLHAYKESSPSRRDEIIQVIWDFDQKLMLLILRT